MFKSDNDKCLKHYFFSDIINIQQRAMHSPNNNIIVSLLHYNIINGVCQKCCFIYYLQMYHLELRYYCNCDVRNVGALLVN